MQYIVDKADVEYCFCQEKRLLPILKNIGKIKKIVSMDEEDNGICSWKDFLRMRCSETEDVGDEKINIHALCDIMFTSGSTSAPKGVMMTHDMITVIRVCLLTARSRGTWNREKTNLRTHSAFSRHLPMWKVCLQR